MRRTVRRITPGARRRRINRAVRCQEGGVIDQAVPKTMITSFLEEGLEGFLATFTNGTIFTCQ